MRIVRFVAGPVVAALVLLGCGDSDSGQPAATGESQSSVASMEAPTTNVDQVRDVLCAAFAAAADGDVTGARQAFDHGPLHELAEAAIPVNRGVAARLLEAKEAVESAIAADDTAAAEVADKLEALIVATSEALAVTGSPDIQLCPQETP